MSRYYIQPIDPTELAARFSTEDMLDPIHGQDEDWAVPRLDKIQEVLCRLPDRETDLIRLYFFRNKKQTDIAEIFGITQAAVSYRIKRALSRIRFLVEMPDLDKNDVYERIVDYMPTKMDAEIFREIYESTCQSEVAKRLGITQGRVRHRYIKNLQVLGDVVVKRIYGWANTLDPETSKLDEIITTLNFLAENSSNMDPKMFEDDLVKVCDWCLEIPEELQNPELRDLLNIYKVFKKIRYNFNILREVKLPKWSNRAVNTIA